MAAKSTVAVGRRKTSVARIFLSNGTGKITVNDKEAKDYFTVPRMLQHAMAGLQVTGTAEKYDIKIRVSGGGINGQSGAVRLGIARAIQMDSADLRPNLKKAGLLTRDPRMVERKKFGLHKARRGTQFSKR